MASAERGEGRNDPHRNLARLLAHNKKAVRDATIKKLGVWIAKREAVSDMDLLKIWKGLFYCFWMSDKRPVQAELSQKISQLIHQMKPYRATAFLKATYETLGREWGGIDVLRMDKFMLLVRDVLFEQFIYMKNRKWETNIVTSMMRMLSKGALLVNNKTKRGLTMHIIEIFLDELDKALDASNEELLDGKELDFDKFLQLLSPFLDHLRFSEEASHVEFLCDEMFERVLLAIEDKDSKESLGDFKCLQKIMEPGAFSGLLLGLAAEPFTRESNRERIYELRESVKALLSKRGEKEVSFDDLDLPISFYEPPVKEVSDSKVARKSLKKRKSQTASKDTEKSGSKKMRTKVKKSPKDRKRGSKKIKKNGAQKRRKLVAKRSRKD